MGDGLFGGCESQVPFAVDDVLQHVRGFETRPGDDIPMRKPPRLRLVEFEQGLEEGAIIVEQENIR